MNSVRASYLAAVLAILFWGTTYALSKFVVPDPLSPMTFTAIRSVLGLGSLLLFLALSKQIQAFKIVFVKHFWSFLMIGAIFYTGAYVVQYWGISYTTATHQAIISETQTFWVVLINFVYFKQKPRKIFLLGALLAFIGVVLVATNDDFSLSPDTITGDIISIFAFILWGAYTAFCKPLTNEERPIFVTIATIFWGTVVIVPIAFLFGGISESAQLSGIEWVIMVYLGIVCIGLTFVLWNFALSNKNVPSENISLFTMLTPIIGITTSYFWLGEEITPRIIIGCAIILLALFLAEYPGRKIIAKYK
jgi:drug/metabolite transporter (DMT)-like permease